MTLFQSIVRKINRTISGSGCVTADQVERIANGQDKTESHPVWQAIVSELKRRKVQISNYDK